MTPGSGPLPTVFVDRRPHGVETDPALVRAGLRTAEHAEAVVAELMDTGEPPTGVIALRNILSTGSLRAPRNAGTTDRVALVGFDDFPTADNESWAERKGAGDWLFAAPKGGPLSEPNWKRSVGWSDAIAKIGRPGLRVHDLRHTCASVWLGAGADPKVVQRILGHASAAMTMDLYCHLIDQNLWDAARKIGGILGASGPDSEAEAGPPEQEGSG